MQEDRNDITDMLPLETFLLILSLKGAYYNNSLVCF